MPANIETMFYVREVPWHGLGTMVQEAPTSEEALRLAELDWRVEQHDVWVDGMKVPNYKANVRDKDNSVLGIVSNRYAIVQNTDAFAFTDAIVGNGEVEVRYETAGSLASGKRIWLLAKMPSTTVLGDEIEPYLVFTNSHDGTGSIKVAMTPIRVVCQNTLTLALGSTRRVWSTKHMGDLESKMHEAQVTLQLAKEYIGGMEEVADILSQKKVTHSLMNDFINELFPLPELNKSTILRKIENAKKIRNTVIDIYNEADDLKRFKGNAWGLFNAVTDFASHAEPLRKTKNFQENRMMDLVDGSKIISLAQDFLMAV